MNTKISQARRAIKGSDEQMSLLEILLTGKAGPMPIDVSDGETQSSESDVSSENLSKMIDEEMVRDLMEIYPDLTEETALKMIAEFG